MQDRLGPSLPLWSTDTSDRYQQSRQDRHGQFRGTSIPCRTGLGPSLPLWLIERYQQSMQDRLGPSLPLWSIERYWQSIQDWGTAVQRLHCASAASLWAGGKPGSAGFLRPLKATAGRGWSRICRCLWQLHPTGSRARKDCNHKMKRKMMR